MKPLTILAALAMGASIAWAGSDQPKCLQEWDADSARLAREGENLFSVAFALDLDSFRVGSEEAVVFTPVIYNGPDSLELPSVGVYGRNRFFHYERRGSGMITGPDEAVFKAKDAPEALDYSQVTEYRPWFNGASLKLKSLCYGCCFHLLGQREIPLGRFLEPHFPIHPKYVYEPGDPVVEGELSGQARVQFVVDRWQLHYDKFGNGPELDKITASIDTVKADPDLTITEVWLKGFASPEATWQHNTMLARNRVQAVREYVENLYKFEPGIIVTEFQPEDWAGLRAWVENSNIDNREGILEIIDAPVTNPDKDWDAKDREIGRKYPKERKFLLNNVYPPLRHTEYKVKYRVRRFLDRDEIRRVMKTEPGKLTVNDFNIAAEGYEPGSPEFNEVYDIMARVYPDSPVANLNAANASLQSGALEAAERHLAKAGDSPEADYSRGLLLLLREDYAGARPLIAQAAEAGIDGASELLSELDAYLDYLNERR
ncbi:MAG: hypothetical protein K2N16_05465 [Muribaculaceae bacterium]|nr:hypothetical protein [Muribaculaceae bacterium]